MKYMHPRLSAISWMAASVIFVISLAFFILIKEEQRPELIFSVSNTNDAQGQLYFDRGKGFQESDMIPVPLVADGKMHEYKISIRADALKKLRIDPGYGPGVVVFGDIFLKTRYGEQHVSCQDLHAGHALAPVGNSTAGQCGFTVADNDPSLAFTVKSAPLLALTIPLHRWLKALGFALVVFCLFVYATHRDSGAGATKAGRIRAFYLFTAAGFFVFCALNLNVSSQAAWGQYVSLDHGDGILVGHAKSIRSDEWLVQTPFYASQVAHGFAINNGSLGDGESALVATVPVKTMYGYAQPRFWGFYAFGFEKGFAWLWAWRIFALLASLFTLFLILTRENFWLSVTGSIWVFLSPFVQWWFSTNLPDMLIGFAAGVSALYYALRAKSVAGSICAAVVLFFAAVTFYTALYPAFQIPLFYLALGLTIALIWRDWQVGQQVRLNFMRIGFVAVALALALQILWVWFYQAAAIIQLIQNSVYPGHHVSTGGGMPLVEVFSGFMGMFLSESHYPPELGNPCEAASFLLLFPLVAASFLWHRRTKHRIDPVEMFLCAYVVTFLMWMAVGFPSWLAGFTRLEMSLPGRATIGLGIASIILVITRLGRLSGDDAPRCLASPWMRGLAFVVLALGFALIAWLLAHAYPEFVTARRAAIASLLLAATALAFLLGAHRIFGLLIFIQVANGLVVNPLSHGTLPLQADDLKQMIEREKTQNPGAWLVFEDRMLPQYLKANGADVWNGVRFMSAPAQMLALDPQLKYKAIWYRYAHFIVQSEPVGTPASFQLAGIDVVKMQVDPCSDVLARMGINHFGFTAQQNPDMFKCLTPLHSTAVHGLWLYRRH